MNDIDVEFYVIGSIISGTYAGEIFADTSEEDFTNSIFREIYSTLKKLWQETGTTEFAVAVSLMQDDCKVAGIRAVEALEGLPPSSAAQFVAALKERNSVAKAHNIAMQLLNASTLEEARELQNALAAATAGNVKHAVLNTKDGLYNFLSTKDKKKVYFTTGYKELDKFTFIEKGDFVIIAGEQSSGKTAFSLTLAMNMAKNGHKVVFFSLETSSEKLIDRMITSYAGLNFNNVKRQSMSDDDWNKVGDAIDGFSKLNIDIVSASGRTVDWIKAEALRLGAEIIFIDYLGLINAKGKSRYEVVTNVSLDLHTMAQSSGITVIALSQLRRPDATKPRAPNMHDLRESGQIEADADLIVLLYNDKANGEYYALIEKNKEGETGYVQMSFDGAHQRFFEWEKKYE